MAKPKDSFVIQSILVHWHDIQRMMHKHMESSASGPKKKLQELTFLQMRTLFYIQHNEPVNMRSLSKWLGTTASSTSILVDRLVEMQWLTRVPDTQDRRVTFLKLTVTAERQLARLMAERTKHVTSVLGHLSGADLHALDNALQKFQLALLHDE